MAKFATVEAIQVTSAQSASGFTHNMLQRLFTTSVYTTTPLSSANDNWNKLALLANMARHASIGDARP
eukprot:5748782-Karenia_brevis.AAC.1